MNINLAKCPKCEQSLVFGVNINEVDGFIGGQSKWRCVAYSCRSCHATLSVQMDPIAIKADTINAIKGR